MLDRGGKVVAASWLMLTRGVSWSNPQCSTPLLNGGGCRASSGNVLFRRLQIAKKAGRWLFSRQAYTLWYCKDVLAPLCKVYGCLYSPTRHSHFIQGAEDLIRQWLDLINEYFIPMIICSSMGINSSVGHLCISLITHSIG